MSLRRVTPIALILLAGSVGACSASALDAEAAGGTPGGGGDGATTGYPFPDKPDGPRDRQQAQSCTSHGDCAGELYCLPIAPPTPEDGGLRCVPGCDALADCVDATCFRWYGAGDTDVPRGFCAGASAVGQACDSSHLVFCAGDTERPVLCYPDRPGEGRCWERCRPSDGGSCADPAAQCTDFFVEADDGLCVTPTIDGTCDLVTRFCGAGESCVVSAEGIEGRCFARCDPTVPLCEAGRACVPVVEGERTSGVCMAPAPVDGPCDPERWSFCEPTAICVDEGERGMLCRPDCTADPQSCPAGRYCLPLPDDAAGRSICAG